MEIDAEQKEQVDNMLADFFPAEQAETVDVPEETKFEESANEEKGEESKVDETETAEETPIDIEDKERTQTSAESVVTEKKVEEPQDEIALIKKQNEMLLQRIEELSGKVMNPEQPKQQEEQSQQAGPVVIDVVGDDDIDDIVSSKELFNAAISKAIMAAEERAVQKILVSIPNIVMKQTQQQAMIKQATDDFYKENPDLEPVKKTVAAVASEIYSTNPQLSITDIFKQSAEKTREILGIRKQAMRVVNEQGRSPELVKKTQGNRVKTKPAGLDKMQQELADLLNF